MRLQTFTSLDGKLLLQEDFLIKLGFQPFGERRLIVWVVLHQENYTISDHSY